MHRAVLALLLCFVFSPVLAQTEDCVVIMVGHAGGLGGEAVDVPVMLLDADQPLQPLKVDVAGVDLDLSWNPALAALSGVELTADTEAWILAWNAPAPGTVAISLATLDPLQPLPGGTGLISLKFTLGNVSGSTDLVLTDTRMFQLDQSPVCHVGANGQLDVGAVAAETVTFGATKARF